MRNDALTLMIRATVLVALGMVSFMLIELIPTIWIGLPNMLQPETLSTEQTLALMNGLSQGANELMTVAFTVIAIAVPLTADMYSLKFLEFIIKDKVITSILMYTVFVNLNTNWVIGMISPGHIPLLPVAIAVTLVLLSFSVIFPYLYYVFRFLHPLTLLTRLEAEIDGLMEQAASNPARSPEYRRRVAAGIEHLADIGIRTIERADRNTAIECVHALERVVHAYWKDKPNMPADWFKVEPVLFLGFAGRAIDDITANRTWVEMKLMSQLTQVIGASLTKLHDVVGTTAYTLCRLGQSDHGRSDPALRELTADYFNTFVRLAIVNRDVRSVFIVFDQYRNYAQSMNAEHPDMVREIGYYFEYYAQVARDNGLNFIVESLAYDLGILVRHAYDTQAENRLDLLQRLLDFDEAAKPPLPGVKKAQAILASSFLQRGDVAVVQRIHDSFLELESRFVQTLRNDLLRVTREEYWEVSGRRINIEYVPPAQREKLREFFDGVLTAKASAH